MSSFDIYGTSQCPACDSAKALLTAKSIDFEFHNCDDDPELFEKIIENGMRSVPAVFYGERLIGGLKDLETFLKQRS